MPAPFRSSLAGIVSGIVAVSVLAALLYAAPGDPPAAPDPAAPAAPDERYVIDVRDFGAVGDGVHDDTAALRRAFDAAGFGSQNDWRAVGRMEVLVPPGHYRVTETIELRPRHQSIVIRGMGIPNGSPPEYSKSRNRTPRGPSQIIWDGPQGGVMFDVTGVCGFELSRLVLSGAEKAGVLMKVNSFRGNASALFMVDRVVFADADTGVECGSTIPVCASDMTFMDCHFTNLKTGFRTMNGQNLNYLFLRCGAGWTETVYHFAQGGSAVWNLGYTYHTGKVIKIDSGGINAGNFEINGFRPDGMSWQGQRTVFLEAKGEVNVKVSGLCSTCTGPLVPLQDKANPLFILGPSAQVSVEASMLSGPVARLTGKENAAPTWLQFDNCRFRFLSDPRKIEHDAHSGYELRNCTVNEDRAEGDKYVGGRTIMIPHRVRYPSQVEKPR
jgi:hypothetical protein